MTQAVRTTLVVLLLSAVFAPAAVARAPAGCVNPDDSALNQYCETIPSSGGGQTPKVGLPSVAPDLPTSIARRIARGPDAAARKALLSLPAARRTPRGPVTGPVTGDVASVTRASASTLPAWLIVLLAALATGLVGGALVRRRPRGDAGPGDRPSA